MRHLVLPLFLGALGLAACKPATTATPAPAAASTGPLTTDDQRTLYALGLVMGQRMGDFNLNPAELAIVQRGIADQVTGAPPAVELQTWGPRINDMARTRQGARAEQEHVRGRAFAEAAAREAGAVRTPSGLVYRELQAGTGPTPQPTDTVRVHYRGTLINGTEFDSSRSHGNDPVEFPLNGVIPCWTEGVGRMHVGGRARLVCPADIAYGDRGQRQIPAGSTLNFEVELIAIVPPAAPSGGAPGATPEPTPSGTGAGSGSAMPTTPNRAHP